MIKRKEVDKAPKHIQQSSSEIQLLYRIEKFMETVLDLDALLSYIMQETTLATNAESCSLALYDEKTKELCFYVAHGSEKNERDFERKLKELRLPMDTGVIGWCATHRSPVNIPDAYIDPRFDNSTDRKTGFTTKTILAVPIVRHDRLIGVVEAVNKHGTEPFSGHDQQVLEVLAAQAGLAIENAQLVEQNLKQARFSALGQAIAGAAHCIKNILNGIDGGSYILDLGVRDDNKKNVKRGWEILSRNTGYMKDLVLDMLSYAKPQKPQLELSDANEICRDVADLMRVRCEERNVVLVLDLEAEVTPVMIDSKGIYRCILNLVTNALDACDGNMGCIAVTSRMDAERGLARIEVADTGIGISNDDRKRMFSVFFSTKGSKGNGLGLSVTQKTIEEHGGTIRFESQKGKGTTFFIEIPISPE